MSDQDLFGDDKNKQIVGDPNKPQDDPFADQLGEIKNENGEQKYKDVATALQALQASQQFIEQLKSEKAEADTKLQEANAELTRMGSIDDFVKKISPNAAPTDPPATPEGQGGLSEEDVVNLLNQGLEDRLAAQKRTEVEKANLSSVIKAVSEAHGDKAAEHIQAKAAELKTTPAALKDLAKSNPTMALQLLGGVSTPSAKPSESTTIPSNQFQKNNEAPTWEKGIARGGLTNKELMERFRQSKEYTNKRIGLE